MSAKEVRDYAKRTGFGHKLYAVLDIDGRTRTYRAPRTDEIDGAETLATALLDDLEETPDGTSALPDEPIVKSQYRRYNNLVYGIDTFRGLFNDRQLYVLGTLCEAVRAAYEQMIVEGMKPDRASAVATYLGFMIDKLADYGSTFATWRTTVEASRSTFARQALPNDRPTAHRGKASTEGSQHRIRAGKVTPARPHLHNAPMVGAAPACDEPRRGLRHPYA